MNTKNTWVLNAVTALIVISSIGAVLGVFSYSLILKRNFSHTIPPPGKTENDSFCEATLTDIDKNIYNTVRISTQCWMKENLRVARNPKGNTITRYCYNEDPEACDAYGGLYNWKTVMDGSGEEGAQGICPEGWHVPKDSEWHTLESNLAAGACSSDRGIYKNPYNAQDERLAWDCNPAGTELQADGSSGFSAILDPANMSEFWTSTKTEGSETAVIRNLELDRSTVYRSQTSAEASTLFVRCIKN